MNWCLFIFLQIFTILSTILIATNSYYKNYFDCDITVNNHNESVCINEKCETQYCYKLLHNNESITLSNCKIDDDGDQIVSHQECFNDFNKILVINKTHGKCYRNSIYDTNLLFEKNSMKCDSIRMGLYIGCPLLFLASFICLVIPFDDEQTKLIDSPPPIQTMTQKL